MRVPSMRKKIFITLLLVAALSLLAACGGGDEEAGVDEEAGGVGNAANGEELYMSATIGEANLPGCNTCHNVQPTDDPLQPSPVGPSHYGVAARADDYVEGVSAEAYLRESIVEPNAHIVEGFQPDVMPQNYDEGLTEREIDNLVAYLLTLEGD